MAANVLVVDDEETVAITLGEILAEEGYVVVTATSAPEALDQIEQGSFDLALVDLRVGDESGLGVLSRLLEISPDTVALILTGYGSLETAIQAMRQGVFDYLLKPCDVLELKAAVARGLRQRHRLLARQNVEDAQNDLTQALNLALKTREDFLAVASHELKTPLSVVIGWAQYVQRQLDRGRTEDAAEKLDMVVAQAKRLARLVEDFIDVARIQYGSLGLALETHDICPLVNHAVRDAASSWPRTKFRMLLPGHALTVNVDEARFLQMLGNLLENGAKFSSEVGEVGIQVSRVGRDVVISIRDKGVGILPQDLPRIYDCFYQADQDILSRRFGGIGVGLYVSRALARAHGGDLEVTSQGTDQGTTVTVTLPCLDGPFVSGDIQQSPGLPGP